MLATISLANGLLLSDPEIAKIIRHGPWPPDRTTDPSNRASGQPKAIAYGRALFFDPRLSRTGAVSCATCHQPEKGWTDGLSRSQGIARLDRNAMSLMDAANNRWFGWDGRNDSLWAHTISPIIHPDEMGADAAHVARVLAGSAEYVDSHKEVFGSVPTEADAEITLVNAAKAIATFQETIVSGRTSFDDFRDALARDDRATAGKYPVAAQRGAQIFFGKGNCNACHTGAAFTNGEFADAGVSYFIEPGRVDKGRHGGITQLMQSPFNLLGRYNDDPDRKGAWVTRQVINQHSNFGAFKVPTLRGLTRTAPYFHNGSKATLTDVARHYSEINPERLHSDGAQILKPLNLTDKESADLVAFLMSLSD